MVITVKKTVLLLSVILLLIGVCGCGMRGQKKIDQMVAYINNKYDDDTFEFASMSGGHLGSNTTKIIVESQKFPNKRIYVFCTDVDGTSNYSDTYLNVKFEEQTYTYIKTALQKEYGENIYLSYLPDNTASMKNGSAETTFEEFISAPDTFISFSAAVVTDASDEEKTLAVIKELFAESVIKARIYFMDTDGDLSETAEELIRIGKYARRLYIVKSATDRYSKAEWVDGI